MIYLYDGKTPYNYIKCRHNAITLHWGKYIEIKQLII